MTAHEGDKAWQLARAGLTDREAEVLAAVAERLRNREIAARLHVSVRTVESHIAALRRKLGGIDRAGLAEIGVQLRRTARTGANLPSPLTSLIGRDSQTDELVALLRTHRLVTLTGPAGVGKTRLALRTVTAHADAFPDGAHLADLAPVGRELVDQTLAQALGIVPQPGLFLRDVIHEVAPAMQCLLLVDNCEHVVADAAGLVGDLLSAGGQMRVLATSREPLGVPGEVSYQVQTLPVPPPQPTVRAREVGNYDAVRLFVDRAATASPGFTLTDAIAPAVTALCRRLDGLPLAIELAAARVRSFSPAELVQHLDRRFELLSAGARIAPPRHRTLRGAIDWSYDLLDDDERALFDRLGVFPAEFDYEAVQSVCAAGDHHDPGALTLLPQLVDKSLVATIGRGTRRYRLLETIRTYAAERLAASAADTAVRRRHVAYYLALAEDAAEQLRGPDQRAWLDRLTTEQPNLRAAIAHDVAVGDLESAWRWIAALERFWDATGQRREAYEWIRQTLAAGQPPATSAAVAGLAAASMLLRPSDARAAFDLAQQATRLGVNLDDLTRARTARAVGTSALWVQPELTQPALREALDLFGDDHPWESAVTMLSLANTISGLAGALRWARASVDLFLRVGDQMYAANSLFMMAQRSFYAGIADDDVHEWLTQSQALAEAAGSEDDRAHATVGFAQLAWIRGDHEHAAQLMEQCLPTLRRIGDRRCTGRALYFLGKRAHEQEQVDHAEELLRGSIEAIAHAGQTTILVNALEALAVILHTRGHPSSAAVLLGTAHTARESGSAHLQPIPPPDAQLSRILAQALGSAAFEDAYKEGERLPPAQALQLTFATPNDS
jgi:predicted ATPase/DNA-binding CsgD family transcriptional regulator